MKITDIRNMLLRGPRLHLPGGGKGTINKLLVRVDTDAGLYGLGEADYYMGVRDALGYIKAFLLGRNPLDICPMVSEVLYGTLAPHPADSQALEREAFSPFVPILDSSPTAVPVGPIVWAISGVEMALCDLAGKILQTPVYYLLGGKYRDRVQVYLDRSAPQDKENLDAWKRMAAEAAEEGFTHIKFDIDYTAPEYTKDVWNRSIPPGQMRRIVERLTAVRQTVGWDMALCADCHRHYNAADAIQVAQELAPLKLSWLEDPTPTANIDSCIAVREKSPIPICVGEMFTADLFQGFVDRQACDIVHPDVIFCGGLHEARLIAGYAELHHMPMAMHGNGGSLATMGAAHVAAASRTFLGLEYHFIESQWISEYVTRAGAPLFKNGMIELTDAPGLGVELNAAVCRQYLAPGESLF
ncbi:MAG: mandelate racemase/muconate lactonizing enzyme family protein [Chloroflexi bacterium]|nr:mandelate racemase/muconate lactonizing enzyme family protein [Chloroflexota bacterium]